MALLQERSPSGGRLTAAPAPALDEDPRNVRFDQLDTDDDILYTPAIPGADIVYTEKELLDLWVRKQQMTWLNESEGKAELAHLNRRVKGRVMLAHQREVRAAAARTNREVLWYFVFVGLFSAVLSSFTLGESFALSQKLREQILGLEEEAFSEVQTYDDVWDFLEEELNPTVFPEDTDDVTVKKNTMIGALRLEQTRINKNEGCTVPAVYQPIIATCYPALSSTDESQNSFGRDRQFEAEEIGYEPFTYWAFTYNVPSDVNLTRANQLLEELKDQSWMDLETRRLRVKLTYYNPAVDMFCSMMLEFNFEAHGGILSESSFRVFDPQRHLLAFTSPETVTYFPPSALQSGLLAVECLFFIMIVLSTVSELRWLCRWGLYEWVSSVWHMLELINCIVLLAVYFLRYVLLGRVDEFEFAPKPEEYSDFYEVAYIVHQVQNWLAVAALITYGKFVKYLQINQQVSALTRTFMYTRHLLLGQLVAIAIVVMGFVFALHHAFGRHVYVYSTVRRTMDNTFAIVLGEFDWDELVEANPLVGPFIFICFMILFFFILYNLIIAILMNAYSDIRRSDEERKGRDKALLATRDELRRQRERLLSWARRHVMGSRFVQRWEARMAVRRRLAVARSQRNISNHFEREAARRHGSQRVDRDSTLSKSSARSGFLRRSPRSCSPTRTSSAGAAELPASQLAAEKRARGDAGRAVDISTQNLGAPGAAGPLHGGRGAQIRVRWQQNPSQDADEVRMVDHRAEVTAATPEAFVAVAQRLLADEKHAGQLHALRRLLELPSDATAYKVAIGVLEQAGLPASKVLTPSGIEHALNAADMMVANGEKRAQIELDVRAIDLSADGELNDWHRSMAQLDAQLRKLGGDVGHGGGQMQARLGSIAAAMRYLQTSGRLQHGFVPSARPPTCGAPPTPPRSGKQPMHPRARVTDLAVAPRFGAPAAPLAPLPEVAQAPRPRVPRYRRTSRADAEPTERVGSRAPPEEMRPHVRSLHLPGIGHNARVRRRPVSQLDFEERDTEHRPPPPKEGGLGYLGNTGGRVFNVFASAVGASRSHQHDRSLDAERTGRRVRREPRSVIPPRMRAAAGPLGAARGTVVMARGEAAEAAGSDDTASASSSIDGSTSGSRGHATPPAAAAPAEAAPTGVTGMRARPASAGRQLLEVAAIDASLASASAPGLAARAPSPAAAAAAVAPPPPPREVTPPPPREAPDAAPPAAPSAPPPSRGGFMALFTSAGSQLGGGSEAAPPPAAPADDASAAPSAAALAAAPQAEAPAPSEAGLPAEAAADVEAAQAPPREPRGSVSLVVPELPAPQAPPAPADEPAGPPLPVQLSWLAGEEREEDEGEEDEDEDAFGFDRAPTLRR